MEMMKAVVYDKPGRANGSVKEIPRPVCGDNDVLIKVMACGICKPAESSHDRTGSLLGVYPAVPGHEFAGIAVEVGKNVKHVKVGDRVTADNGVQCGTCYYCQIGLPTMCENFKSQGHNLQGGFAQYVLCKAEKVYTFSEKISFDSACLCELTNCALSCVDNCELKYGDNVAIIGCGSSGSLIAQLIKNSCADRVVALDILPSKLERVSKLGIETILVDPDNYDKHENALKEMFPYGIDVIVDAAGDDGPMVERMMRLLAPKGRFVMYSFFYREPKTVKIEPGLLIRKGLKITSAPLQMYRFRDCINILEQGKVDPGSVISCVYPLEKYFEALDRVMNDPEVMKVIIHPND